MSILWTSDNLSNLLGNNIDTRWDVSGVSIDSRSVNMGDLFIALEGDFHNGHDFVLEAIEKGAVAAVVKYLPEFIENKVSKNKLLIVDDTEKALISLAVASRKRSKAKILAITGSVGKTSTKDALSIILNQQGLCHSTSGNFNNHIGLPLSLARMELEANYGVFELGMNNYGEINYLSNIVRPHVSIITNIDAVHLEFFNSVRDIAIAKAEIFNGMPSSGIAIVPRDSEFYELLVDIANSVGVKKIITFGSDVRSSYRLIDSSSTDNGMHIYADFKGERVEYEIGMFGSHMAINSLAVLAGVDALGGNLSRAMQDFKNIFNPKGRGNRSLVSLENGEFLLINESYNASPASVKAMIKSLVAEKNYTRKILVLGDMLELGPDAPTFHSDLSQYINDSEIDLVFTCGSLMLNLYKSIPEKLQGAHAENSQGLAVLVSNVIQQGDVVAVKGSADSKMSSVIELLESLGSIQSVVKQEYNDKKRRIH